jgi:hypothetical protein
MTDQTHSFDVLLEAIKSLKESIKDLKIDIRKLREESKSEIREKFKILQKDMSEKFCCIEDQMSRIYIDINQIKNKQEDFAIKNSIQDEKISKNEKDINGLAIKLDKDITNISEKIDTHVITENKKVQEDITLKVKQKIIWAAAIFIVATISNILVVTIINLILKKGGLI